MLNQRNTTVQWGMLVIEIVAGAWTLLHLIWSASNITTDDYWGVTLPILFLLALILAFVQYFQQRPALVAAAATEQFPEPAIAKFFLASAGSAGMWFVVRMYVGAEWLLAGWEKVITPAVWGTNGLAIKGFAAGALAQTGGAHPAVQGWYASFLQNIVLPNAGLFSFLVTWGEVAVGVGLLLGVLTGVAAGFGVLMNLNYLLAGTVSINPVLGVLGLFLCFSWRVCGWVGIDRWLLPALGLPWKPGTLFQAPGPAAAT